MEKPCGALWGMVAKHRIPSRIQAQGGARGLRRDALEIPSSEPLNTSEQVQGNTYTRLTRQSHRCLDEPDYTRQSHRCLDEPKYRGKALWSTVGHGCETPDPQQDSSPRRCQKRAQRCSRNSIFGTGKYKAIQSKYTRHTRHRRQSHRCLDEPEYRGKALWSTVGHGCETPDPQQDSSRRRCQKRAQRCSRNSIFGTAKYKANLQGIQGIEGKAIDVWMNRSTVEKCCGARWGMVAKHRIPSRIQAQGGARSVRRDALEIASSEPLNTRHTRHTMQNKAYKA